MKQENYVDLTPYQPLPENNANVISKELETAIKKLIENMRNSERINHKINS